MKDPLVEEMLSKGYAIQNEDGTFRLTEKGEQAFIEMVKSDPEHYAKIFPDFVKKEWIH